jgi:hypothetical protein
VGRDYYVASVFNLAAQQVTFYLQDLTNAGPLQTSTAAHPLTTLNTTSGLVIGGFTVDAFEFGLDGLIDEVRLSNTVLAPSDLLVSAVPVPAAVWLLCSALGGLGFARRRIR